MQKRLEQQRLSQSAGPSVVLATGAGPGDANAMAIPPEWLLQPAERGAPMVQCLIKREKGALGLWPIYRMYLQRDNGDVFVLAARRRKGVLSEGHSFLISRDEKDLEKGPNYVGKLRSNLAAVNDVGKRSAQKRKQPKEPPGQTGSLDPVETGSVAKSYNVKLQLADASVSWKNLDGDLVR